MKSRNTDSKYINFSYQLKKIHIIVNYLRISRLCILILRQVKLDNLFKMKRSKTNKH